MAIDYSKYSLQSNKELKELAIAVRNVTGTTGNLTVAGMKTALNKASITGSTNNSSYGSVSLEQISDIKVSDIGPGYNTLTGTYKASLQRNSDLAALSTVIKNKANVGSPYISNSTKLNVAQMTHLVEGFQTRELITKTYYFTAYSVYGDVPTPTQYNVRFTASDTGTEYSFPTVYPDQTGFGYYFDQCSNSAFMYYDYPCEITLGIYNIQTYGYYDANFAYSYYEPGTYNETYHEISGYIRIKAEAGTVFNLYWEHSYGSMQFQIDHGTTDANFVVGGPPDDINWTSWTSFSNWTQTWRVGDPGYKYCTTDAYGNLIITFSKLVFAINGGSGGFYYTDPVYPGDYEDTYGPFGGSDGSNERDCWDIQIDSLRADGLRITSVNGQHGYEVTVTYSGKYRATNQVTGFPTLRPIICLDDAGNNLDQSLFWRT